MRDWRASSPSRVPWRASATRPLILRAVRLGRVWNRGTCSRREWNGKRLRLDPTASDGCRWHPLLSTRRSPEACRSRIGNGWADRTRQRRRFLAFHRSHPPRRGPYSPCMHRDDVQTVSFSWVTVNESGLNLYYSPGPPCRLSCEPNRRHEEAVPRRASNQCLPCC